MEKHYFVKNIEKMIDPIDVGTIHFMQEYMQYVPAKKQLDMITKSAHKNPYMGFVVEPYSFFLSYKIKDIEWANRLLPDHYQLVKTKVFQQDTPDYYGIFGTFNTHTSAFWGTRMEFYIIALNTITNLISWVIVDYDTNTVSFDEQKGLIVGSTKECIFTSSFAGDIIIDIQGTKDNRSLIVNANIKNGTTLPLDKRLWVEGNLSITYSKELAGKSNNAFSVAFNPLEVAEALSIDHSDIEIVSNTWLPGLLEDEPVSIACFPYAQHFLSDSPGHYSNIQNEGQLNEFIEKLDFKKIPNYSSKVIKKRYQQGQLVSILLIIILLSLLIIK